MGGSSNWYTPPGSVEPLWVPPGGVYDPTLPDLFEEWCYELLTWTTGFTEGRPVEWTSWQRDRLIRPTLGLIDKATGRRTTRTAFFLAARGDGKTAYASAIALFFLTAMGEKNPEVDLFAASRIQAGRLWKQCDQFVRASPVLAEVLTIYTSTKTILYAHGDSLGEIVVRSGDADAELGLNPSLAIIDELLAQKNRALWDAIVTAAGKRKNSLLLAMTTPSVRVETFAKREYEIAKRIEQNRSLKPSYLPVIYEADPDDDPGDEATWHKACPALKSGFFDIEVYRDEYATALLDPEAMHAFKVYRLCIWADAAAHGFVSLSVWDQNIGDLPDVEVLEGWPAWIGLDMAGTTDLASEAVLWWDDEADEAWVVWRHWSTAKMFERLDGWTRGAWRVWADDESVRLTIVEGAWIDAEEVAERVIADFEQWQPLDIGIDSYRSRTMFRLLQEEAGLPVTLLSQTGRAMQAATERVQAMTAAGKLRHNGDPIARWSMANTRIRYDSFQFPKIVRADPNVATVRIDPTSALSMAVDRRLFWERTPDEEEEELQVWRI